ncbi:5'-adenylylsulfate reductase-like 5 [Musa acuminata AAA Group]|uniref:5'-adenylylsulfate reductase-like 5 n=1 Tax=Musa acuminata AAA Group TaxID=214697 RepID=UPI0031D55311
MATHSLPLFRLLLILSAFSVPVPRSSAAAAATSEGPFCPRSDLAFVGGLIAQCPRWIELSFPLEVDGESLDRELIHGESKGYYSVLFYASWCPFSGNIRPTFNVLSSMFPQIKHLLADESSTMPSILSRYGIHSFPAIVLSNQTETIRYRGPKDIDTLIQFYKKTTGFDPVERLVVDQPANLGNVRSLMHQVESLRELITTEPYLVLGVLFICLKLVLSVLPVVYSHLKALWVSHGWHLNLPILCEPSQLLVRVLHGIDVNKLWSKVKLGNKTMNLRKGANNARAWASTLTSVSLGESSSPSSSSSSRLITPCDS